MWISIHFHIPYMGPRRITWISVNLCYVVRHRVIGKPWKALELFRFPRVSMIYDVDLPVDFLRKKIPDDHCRRMGMPEDNIWHIIRINIRMVGMMYAKEEKQQW